jgi:hypothetical protein
LALLGLLQNPRGVLGGQAATDGAGLLGPEVKRQVLLVLVEEAELSTLLRVDDGKDTGDRLADVVAIREKKRYVSPNATPIPRLLVLLRKWAAGALGFESTYILVSLVPEETIFWMRSWPSSVLSSPSCLVSSSLFLDHNWPALTLPEDFDILVSSCT